MEQREAAAGVVGAADFPRRKLARQLDFAAMCSAAANVILPDHPQAQLQSKLLALAKLQAPPPPPPPQPQPQPQPQPSQLKPQPQPRPKQPVVLAPRVVRQVQPQPRPILPVVTTESPKSRQRSDIEVKDGTPKKQKLCNCKNSRCLKLYCECFALGVYCDGCNCTNCHNNVEHDATRQKAVGATLERNPNAFRPKILNSPHGSQDVREEAVEVTVMPKHNKGCNCKKTGCLKKYCECFQANILCSENCKCMDCKNFEGSEERSALFHGGHGNGISYVHQAANAAINGAIGTSWLDTLTVSKKTKYQPLIFGAPASNQYIDGIRQFQQGNHFRAPAASTSTLSLPGSCAASATSLRSSKVAHKSLLADVLRSQDVKELCSLLVIVSAEATKAHEDKKDKTDKQEGNHLEGCIVSPAEEKYNRMEENVQTYIPDDRLSGNKVSRMDDSGSDGSDAQTRGPPSPATLALMCDEQDAMLAAAGCPNAAANCNGNMTNKSSDGHIYTELYAEQERVVLTNFWNFLTRIITRGSIKESLCSPLAKAKPGVQEPEENGVVTMETETSRKEHDGKTGRTDCFGNSLFSEFERRHTNGKLQPEMKRQV